MTENEKVKYMSDLSISKIEKFNPKLIHQVLSSSAITQEEKVQFIRKNNSEIISALNIVPTGSEYNKIMENRPLIKYRPLKNSFTKRGDKILLAKSLNIPVSEVDDYVKNVQDSLKKINQFDFLPASTQDALKTYVYRHGSAEQLVAFFDYELLKSKDILKTLYKTLEYNNNGVADYFVRPIHRMKNRTLIDLYGVVDKNLKIAQSNGAITQKQGLETSEWALKRIYQIQHNSKFINSLKIKEYS